MSTKESITSDSSVDDDEVIIGSENEEELEWNWSPEFIQDTPFSSDEVQSHTTITFTNNIKPIDTFNNFFSNDIIELIARGKVPVPSTYPLD
jgi:hypothetical protein